MLNWIMESNQGQNTESVTNLLEKSLPIQAQIPPVKKSFPFLSMVLVLLSLGSLTAVGIMALENMRIQKELSISKIALEQIKPTEIPVPSYLPTETPIATIEPSGLATPTVKVCDSVFTSKYLNLSFKYDNCIWKINETLDSGETTYNTITATNIKSLSKLIVRGENTGMGGGYSSCEKSDEAVVINNKLVRVKVNKITLYLTEKNDPAIKGAAGVFGDSKFNEYFTYLTPEAFPEANVCWKSGGINLVRLSDQTSTDPKDLTISVEESGVKIDFLKEADSLASTIYSSLPKY